MLSNICITGVPKGEEKREEKEVWGLPEILGVVEWRGVKAERLGQL